LQPLSWLCAAILAASTVTAAAAVAAAAAAVLLNAAYILKKPLTNLLNSYILKIRFLKHENTRKKPLQ
jgi:hypothetical protein